jgi:hypothetical protein
MKLVDFDEVVAEAAMMIGYGEDIETCKNFSRQWIWRAKQKMATPDIAIEVCQIHVKNLLARKPKNLKQLLDIALFDASGCQVTHVFHQGNKRVFPNYEVVNEECAAVDVSENSTSYVIGTNGTDVSYVIIRYYPLPLDENNEPQVYEHEVDACKAYVRYQWSMFKNENQSEIAVNRQTWKEECDWAIAKTKSLDLNNEIRNRMAADFNRMIPNYNRSRF